MAEQKPNKITRREMLKMGGMASIGLLAAACAPPAAQTTEDAGGDTAAAVSDTPTDGEVTVDRALWVIEQKDFHPDYNEYVRTKISEYAEEQGWPLDISYIAGFASGSGEVEKLAAAVQAGDPPDLVLHTFAATQLHNLDIILPATDVVEQIEEVYGEAAPYLKQIYFLDGEWWLVPYHQRSGGGYYRRDAFDGIGVDLQEVRTYEALREKTLEVTDVDNELFGWGITVNRSGDGNSIINRVKTGYGAGWQDETGQFIRTNSAEMVDAMNFLKETYTDPQWASMLPPGVLAWNDISNNEAYLGEKIAYTENAGTVFAKAVVDGNPVADKTNYLKPPGGPVNQEFQTVGGKNWYFMKNAKNTAAAKQLVLDFTSDLTRMDEMLASSPAYAIPAYTNLWEMSEFTQGYEIALQQKSAALDPSGIDGTVWPGPPSAAMDAINEAGAWNDMVNSIMTGTPVEDAVAEAHDRMVIIFQEFGLPGTE